MENTVHYIKIAITAVGAVVGAFLGGRDTLVQALLAFVIADYISGVLKAIMLKKLNSEVGFVGICKKVLIFVFVGIGNIIDTQILKNGATIRTAIIFFYIANEGISLIENASVLGLPVPNSLKKVLEQIRSRGGDTEEDNKDKQNSSK